SVVVVAVMFSGSSNPEPGHESRTSLVGSGPQYSSVETLAADSHLVALVEIVGVVAREVDRGGDLDVDPVSGEPIPGFPVMFVGARVESVIAASMIDRIEVGSVIPIVRFDSAARSIPGESELGDGDWFVIFLKYRAADSAPGISSVEGFFTVLGGDDGVFQIIDDRAISRGRVQSLLEADVELVIPEGQEAPRLDVDLSDMIAIVDEALAG
ncbi:MAG: hypothetical protein WD652_03975, partial [Acidimicrobiia bacterium]